MLLKSNVERYSLFAQTDANSQHFTAQSLSHGFAVPAPLTQGSLSQKPLPITTQRSAQKTLPGETYAVITDHPHASLG